MKRILFGVLTFAAAVAMLTGSAASQPPGGKDGKDGKGKGPPRFEIGQILPPPLLEELNLTPDQAKEIEAIKADVKAKLDKLLTAEQKKTVENFRPRGGDRGPGGPGGDKGPGGPGGDKGGKGGPGGDKGGRPAGDKKGGGPEAE